MPYPLSSDVSAGQPTAAAHYNALRSDALRLGQMPLDAVTLGELLQRYECNLSLEVLESKRVRVPASPGAPVALVISGMPLVSTQPVDLPLSAAPSGSPAVYYVFAVQSAGSHAFTIDLNTSPGESTGRRMIGQFYWNGSSIDAGSLTTVSAGQIASLLRYEPALVCEGRLTAQSGNPLPAADVPSSATLYFSPFRGNRLAIYSPGRGWVVYLFSELSLSLAGLAGGKNADIFVGLQAGKPTLSMTVWASDSARSQPLAWQDGCAVQIDKPECRYLGTIRTSGAGLTADTDRQRLIWNNANRLRRRLKVVDSTNTWTYTGTVFRPVNGSTLNRVEVVTGLAELPTSLRYLAYGVRSDGLSLYVGIGIDSVTDSSADICVVANADKISPVEALVDQVLSAGYHYLQLLEIGASGLIWYGDYNAAHLQSGAIGSFYG